MRAQSQIQAKQKTRAALHRAAPSSGCAPRAKLPQCESAALRFADFRKAIRTGEIDALVAKRIFRECYTRLHDICERENCSLNRARTINATLECDVNAALLCAGKPGILKAYASVDDFSGTAQVADGGTVSFTNVAVTNCVNGELVLKFTRLCEPFEKVKKKGEGA